MKRIALFLAVLLAQGIVARANSVNLSMVYDPTSKKYFIGGKSKFLLRQGEGGAPAERIEVSINGGDYAPYSNAVTFDREGKYTLKFRAANAVNNWSPEQFVEVFVDLTSPNTELKLPEERSHQAKESHFMAVNGAIVLSAQDNLSGVGTTEYSWDGTNFIPYGGPVQITREGKQTLYYRSTDRVGNVEAVKSVEFTADAKAPHSEVKPMENARTVLIDGVTYVNDSVSFTVAGQDESSGVKQVWVSIDGQPAQIFQKP
ncbi:MAG: hypothetical protein HUU37_11415, partial [Bdellovibrionales bacterium]|nr:hypothetical protein [Bdellovibrionales bacterium]